MRRSKVREHIFKMLFSIGFDAADADEQIELYLEQVEEASEEERGYMRKKVKDIAAHEEEIDAMINEHTTGWKTGRMNKVDLSVLRLAVYEMKWDDEVPVKVAINEAVRRSLCYPADTIQEVPHNLQLLHLQIPDPEDLRKKNVHISC